MEDKQFQRGRAGCDTWLGLGREIGKEFYKSQTTSFLGAMYLHILFVLLVSPANSVLGEFEFVKSGDFKLGKNYKCM